MHASLPSFVVFGIDPLLVRVEVDCVSVNSMDSVTWSIVGLADAAVRESRERVKAALKNSGYAVSQKRITVNLAPADVRKEGSHLDLSIALAVLASTGRLDARRAGRFAALGELGLDGGLKPVSGALPMAIGARNEGLDGLIVPEENAAEAAYVEGLPVYGVRRLTDAVGFLRGEAELSPTPPPPPADRDGERALHLPDMEDVRGQENAKRALEVAAAGGHNLLLIGAPGSGKTMLAKRMPSILPEMTFEEAIETTKIFSISGRLDSRNGLVRTRPFRSPHHTASHVAVVGGGVMPRPGEVSLAHNGVLFLDEFPEFSRQVLEVMRQPLEDRVVHISRAQMSLTFPASFILVAAMNPCPCGYATHPEKRCICNPMQIQKYMGRISGPLLDRIDLHVDVAPVKIEDIHNRKPGEPSRVVRERVNRARTVQTRRFANRPGMFCNAQMTSADLKSYCALSPESRQLLEQAMKGLNLSARAYDRILKVSRTIADLNGAEAISAEHISEAVQYRNLDRENWV